MPGKLPGKLAGCGCNVAAYLVNMAQNTEPGTCDGGDGYCDANAVCGVRCAEVDLIEGNLYAFHATAHHPLDNGGVGGGIGGGHAELQNKYGPHKSPIDTMHPFVVEVDFAVDANVRLQADPTQL